MLALQIRQSEGNRLARPEQNLPLPPLCPSQFAHRIVVCEVPLSLLFCWLAGVSGSEAGRNGNYRSGCWCQSLSCKTTSGVCLCFGGVGEARTYISALFRYHSTLPWF